MNIIHKLKNKHKGYSAIVIVFLVATVGITLATSISSTLIAREKMFRNMVDSVQAYYVAESGVEDMVVRLVDPNLDFDWSTNLSVWGTSVTTALSQDGNTFTINSEAIKNTLQKNIRLSLMSTTDGESFNYGVQIGPGGIEMRNSGTIVGNVYSGGDIVGTNSPIITGDAWVSGNHKIDNFTVNGSAHAHTLDDSAIGQNAYYQTIIDTTVNGTSFPGSADPPDLTMPVTDEEINTWKADVAEGVVLNGDQLIDGDMVTAFGLTKIVGDLNIEGDARVTLGGTLWVTGDIVIQNNAVFMLDPGYGGTSGVVVADGTIRFSNNSRVCGSEGYDEATNVCNTSNDSFIIFVSTANVNRSILLQNLADIRGIVYAPYGEIEMENNAHVVEASANSLFIENNVVVTYDTGLINLNFSSGPGGGWALGQWEEIE